MYLNNNVQLSKHGKTTTNLGFVSLFSNPILLLLMISGIIDVKEEVFLFSQV